MWLSAPCIIIIIIIIIIIVIIIIIFIRSGAPQQRIFGHLSIREILVITWPYIRPSNHPYAPQESQGNQCEISQFLAKNLILQILLWSIDSCQNKVSADQYHMSLSRAQVSTHRGFVFFYRLSADNLPADYSSIDRRLNSKWISL